MNQTIKDAQKRYQVELTEKNTAAMMAISKISNGTCEVVIVRGEIVLIKPSVQRIDLNKPDELSAVLAGTNKAVPIDLASITGEALKISEMMAKAFVEAEDASAAEVGSSAAAAVA
jgi:hypothetical protein